MSDTRINRYSLFKAIILIGVPLFFWRFYWYVGFDPNITALLSFLIAAILVFFLAAIGAGGQLKRINKRSSYSKYILLFLSIAFLSVINAYLYWNQSIILTFRAGYIVFIIIYFYVLYSCQLSYEKGIELIILFTITYLILWMYAVSQVPSVVFGNYDVIKDDRGYARISQLNSIDLVYLAYFISLVKVSVKIEKKKLLWWILLVISFILIILTLSRMVIFVTLVITVAFLLRKKPFYLILALVAVVSSYKYMINNLVISSLTKLTIDEFESGSESALRLVEYTQFFKHYPFNIGTFLLGNGSPHVASDYGIYEESLKWTYRFNRTDAGYVGMYLTYGVTSIVLFLLLFVKVLRQKVSQKAMPFKLFVIFLYIINITSWEFFACGIGFMLSLYFLDQDRKAMVINAPTH